MLRTPLDVQEPVAGAEDDLGPVERWQTLRRIYGEIKPLKAFERVEPVRARVAPFRTHSIRIRYDAELTPEHRLRDAESGAVYHIDGLLDEGNRHRFHLVMAVERA